MDISLEAQLVINGSFPAAVPGNTNEPYIKPLEEGSAASPLLRGRTGWRLQADSSERGTSWWCCSWRCSLLEPVRLTVAALQVSRQASQTQKLLEHSFILLWLAASSAGSKAARGAAGANCQAQTQSRSYWGDWNGLRDRAKPVGF